MTGRAPFAVAAGLAICCGAKALVAAGALAAVGGAIGLQILYVAAVAVAALAAWKAASRVRSRRNGGGA